MSERWRLPRAGVGTFWIRPSAYSPEHGYHGAALAEIARAAGLGNAGLIHHFPSKPALYRAVLERLAEEIDGRLAAAIARLRPNPGGLEK